ncbi:hypothetical protein R3P38DRAFT_3174191 [Favolaschia claudopus]|uniref:Uncharacterized protein n=1 Tax=Favolaschia claudopus TaxID=2862362 RepID=A0AAW0DGP4_9AGAR
MRGRFLLASRPSRCLSFKSLSISITLLCPLLASAFTCPATDKVGGALTKSDPGVDGAVVCTYTSGVCTFPSNGELDRLSSTSIQCPRVAVPDSGSASFSSGGNVVPTGGPFPEPNPAASHSARTIAIAVSISAFAVIAILAALLLRWRRQKRRQQALDEEYLTPERFIPGRPISPSHDLVGGYGNRDSKRGAEKTKTLVPSRPSSRNAGETDSFLSSRVERMEAQLQSLMTTTTATSTMMSTTGAPVTRVGEAPPQYSR